MSLSGDREEFWDKHGRERSGWGLVEADMSWSACGSGGGGDDDDGNELPLYAHVPSLLSNTPTL